MGPWPIELLFAFGLENRMDTLYNAISNVVRDLIEGINILKAETLGPKFVNLHFCIRKSLSLKAFTLVYSSGKS